MIPTYLVKSNQNRYYFRIVVPDDLRSVVGKREIRRSVKTTNLTVATARSLQMAVDVLQQFEELRMKKPPFMSDLLTIRTEKTDGTKVTVNIENDEDARRFKEIQALEQSATDTSLSSSGKSFADEPISKLIQDYLNEYKDYWEPTVYQEYKALYRDALSLMGNIPIRAVTRQRARDLKTALQARRIKGKPLATATIDKTLGKMSSAWKHGIQENLGIPDDYNPWVGLQSKSKERKRAADEQPEYSDSDIQKLFSNEFVKNINNRPARYWVPVLSLFHAFRVGEAAQIRLQDVTNDEGIWCLHICEEMRTKTENAIRTIPIHSKVLNLGFLDFYNWRKQQIEKSKSIDTRLFIDLKINAARKGGALSNWWNNTYTKRFDGISNGTSLHSLRHSCLTNLRAAAGVKNTHIREVAGHERASGELKRYGKDRLAPIVKAIEMVEYPVQIPHWSEAGVTRIVIPKKK